MPYDATVFRVMIASPSDVEKECRIVRETIHEWNDLHSDASRVVLLPISWDTHSAPAMGDRPQAIINRQVLENADLLVAVFWTRIGSDTGKAISGTVEELEEHLAAGKPAMVYFSTQPVHPDSLDAEQYEALKAFKESCKQKGLIESYDSLAELNVKFRVHLTRTVTTDAYFVDRVPQDATIDESAVATAALPAMSDEAAALLVEASKDPSGYTLHRRSARSD